MKLGASGIRKLRNEYPYALYDFEYTINGNKKYLIVRCTATKVKYFNLPINKIQFCNDFKDKVGVLLITDIIGEPKVSYYQIGDMNGMNKRINSICYEDVEA